jgi:hypothetical protein
MGPGVTRPRVRSLFVGTVCLLAGTARPGTARAQATTTWGGADVTLGTFAWRRLGDRSPSWQRGFELAWGPTLAVDQGPFRFAGLVQVDVQEFALSSWAVGLNTNAFEVAARLGPFEPQVRAGVALVTVDDFDGNVSAELLSPRVGMGLGLRVFRKVRITVGAYAEYFWRWFGPSDLMRGLTLDIRFERPHRAHQ